MAEEHDEFTWAEEDLDRATREHAGLDPGGAGLDKKARPRCRPLITPEQSAELRRLSVEYHRFVRKQGRRERKAEARARRGGDQTKAPPPGQEG